jgi:uncharacterized protein YndB with AHSA1/START domain
MIKKALLALFGVLAVAVAVVLIYASTRPDAFRIEQTATIQAPPEKIFPYINDLARYQEWSPWEKKDPNLKRSFAGPPSGPGAVYEWAGNSEVGVGRMEIVESAPPTKVVYDLVFKEPFEVRNTAEISMTSDSGASTVTWAIYGQDNFICKLMTTFFDREAMITAEFEKGLAKLKMLAEK